jgi:hypothetical protein
MERKIGEFKCHSNKTKLLKNLICSRFKSNETPKAKNPITTETEKQTYLRMYSREI